MWMRWALGLRHWIFKWRKKVGVGGGRNKELREQVEDFRRQKGRIGKLEGGEKRGRMEGWEGSKVVCKNS